MMQLGKLNQAAVQFHCYVTVLVHVPFIARKFLIPVKKLQIISQVDSSPGRRDCQLGVERDKLSRFESEFEQFLTGLGMKKHIHIIHPLDNHLKEVTSTQICSAGQCSSSLKVRVEKHVHKNQWP
jgi:hypothetical protein